LDEDGFFYCTIEKLNNNLGLSKDAQTTAINKLIDAGLLIKEVRGMPGTRMFKFTDDCEGILIDLISSGALCGKPETTNAKIRHNDGTKSANNTIYNISNSIINKTLFNEPDEETRKLKHLFKDSPLYDIELFRKVFIQADELGIDIDYYYRAVKRWSNSSGAKKVKWKDTAEGFMETDKSKGKLKMKESESEAIKDEEIMLQNTKVYR